jgi:hypothetical protein
MLPSTAHALRDELTEMQSDASKAHVLDDDTDYSFRV